MTVLAWSWSAPRQAINPNDSEESSIEYLTPKGERKALAYSDLVDVVYRVPLRPRDGEARRAFERARLARHLRRRVQALPAFIRKRFSTHPKLWSAGIRKRLYAGYSTRLSATYCVALMR